MSLPFCSRRIKKKLLNRVGIYRALGFDSSKEEMKEIIETLDPEEEGFVGYDRFLEVAALKMKRLSTCQFDTLLVLTPQNYRERPKG